MKKGVRRDGGVEEGRREGSLNAKGLWVFLMFYN